MEALRVRAIEVAFSLKLNAEDELPAVGIQPQTAFADLGYRGEDKDNPGVNMCRVSQPER